ncbi:MAG: 4-(cytidine 5'-diphospho)-2-C-methyl-D-erythritol kinase [Bacteroidota bacterium]
MITFPNAKINIGLRITGRLPNGYHSLKSLMIPTGFCDILEFIPSKRDILELSGISIPGHNRENILFKTLELLRKFHEIPPLHIHLHKIIPTGAGLGGGSADAAFFLNILDEYFELKISIAEKEKMISEIGSDCTFFIRNKPAIIKGTGTETELYEIDLKAKYLVIVSPGFSISTPEAYAGVQISKEEKPLEILLKEDINKWNKLIINDFEKSLFPKYPVLKEIKEALYSFGALYASLSGSGSALYGIFNYKPVVDQKLKEKIIFEDYIKAW